MQPLLAAGDTGRGNAVSTATTEEPTDKPIATSSGDLAIDRPRSFLGLPATTPWLWTAAISAIAIVCIATLFFVRYGSVPASVRATGSTVPSREVLSPPTPIPEKSLVVLPFDNLSDD